MKVLQDAILKTLASFNTYDTLYNMILEMHPDKDIPVGSFLPTYIKMIVDDDYQKAIYYMLWTKDFV